MKQGYYFDFSFNNDDGYGRCFECSQGDTTGFNVEDSSFKCTTAFDAIGTVCADNYNFTSEDRWNSMYGTCTNDCSNIGSTAGSDRMLTLYVRLIHL